MKCGCAVSVALIEHSEAFLEKLSQSFGIKIYHCLMNSCVTSMSESGLDKLSIQDYEGI